MLGGGGEEGGGGEYSCLLCTRTQVITREGEGLEVVGGIMVTTGIESFTNENDFLLPINVQTGGFGQ